MDLFCARKPANSTLHCTQRHPGGIFTENSVSTTPVQSVLTTPSLWQLNIPEDVWVTAEQRHRARVAAHAEGFVQRRAHGQKHPVWDFLFTYYNFSPNKLLTWVPGIQQKDKQPPLVASGAGLREHAWPAMKPRDVKTAKWVATLCENILSRPARFGCYGLHEWAMVYKQTPEDIRHSQFPLRLPAEEISRLIDSQPLCCTHYDAFRFFTPQAVPLNATQPSLETRQQNEQGGCLHANMDLYKWATKLWPWVGSDLVADAFEVAIAGRAMDMRASPYELSNLGFEPIRIETEQGREEYRREQQALFALAAPVRKRLKDACEHLVRIIHQAD